MGKEGEGGLSSDAHESHAVAFSSMETQLTHSPNGPLERKEIQ